MRTRFHVVLVVLFSIGATRETRASVVTCDPSTALQTCINNATANGSTPGTVVLVPSGTNNVFTVSSLIDLPSNLTIRCEPNVTIQQSANIRVQHQQNILIQGCIFDGQGANLYGLILYSVSHIRITRNTFQNFGNTAIPSDPGGDWNDVEIDGNVFTNAGQYNVNSAPVQLNAELGSGGSSNIRVHHNTCSNAALYTGCLHFVASSSRPITQLAITDNTLSFGSSSNVSMGIQLFSTDNTDQSFQQFTIAKNLINAIVIGSSQPYCISAYGMRGVISENTLSGCSFMGIELIGSNTSVVGNSLSYAGPVRWYSDGSSRSNVVIAGNSITQSYGHAVIVQSGTNGGIQDGTIAHNILDTPASGDGILVQTLSNGTIRDIHIDNNVLDMPYYGTRGIDSEGNASQVQIENNRFVNVAGTGLFLNSGGSAFTIRFNNFSGSGSWNLNYGTSITRQVENIVNGSCCF